MKVKYIEEEDKLLIIPEQTDEIRILGSFNIGNIRCYIHPRGLVITKIKEEEHHD